MLDDEGNARLAGQAQLTYLPEPLRARAALQRYLRAPFDEHEDVDIEDPAAMLALTVIAEREQRLGHTGSAIESWRVVAT